MSPRGRLCLPSRSVPTPYTRFRPGVDLAHPPKNARPGRGAKHVAPLTRYARHPSFSHFSRGPAQGDVGSARSKRPAACGHTLPGVPCFELLRADPASTPRPRCPAPERLRSRPAAALDSPPAPSRRRVPGMDTFQPLRIHVSRHRNGREERHSPADSLGVRTRFIRRAGIGFR